MGETKIELNVPNAMTQVQVLKDHSLYLRKQAVWWRERAEEVEGALTYEGATDFLGKLKASADRLEEAAARVDEVIEAVIKTVRAYQEASK